MSYKMNTALFFGWKEDEELVKLRGEYTQLTGKNPPGINYDTFRGWNRYKEDLQRELEEIKKQMIQENT